MDRPGRWLFTGAVVILASCVLLLSACSAASSPNPQPVVQPTYPVVSPPGVPPITGNGALAVVPAGNGEIVTVPTDLGGGWLATIYLRSQPTVVTVRLQVLPASDLPHPATDRSAGTALVLSLDFYDSATNALLSTPPEGASIAVRPPEPLDVARLAVLRRASNDYETISTTADAATRAIAAHLPASSSLTLAVVDAASSVASKPTQEILTTALGNRAPLPQRLKIPSIGVDAPVTPLGLDPSGIMASPTEGHTVGWYELGPRPGEVSNAVLAGHVDWVKQIAVFFNLSKLKAGDAIEVQSGQDRRYRYQVDNVQLYTLEDAPLGEIFGATSSPTLTLITCGGAFDQDRHEYLERVVVRAHGV